MKKLIGIIAIAVCLVVSGFAESVRYTAKIRTIETESVNYVADTSDFGNTYQWHAYGKLVAEDADHCCYWEGYGHILPEDFFEGADENAIIFYADRAVKKEINAQVAFDGWKPTSEKDDQKRLSFVRRHLNNDTEYVGYKRVIFTPQDVKGSTMYIQVEYFARNFYKNGKYEQYMYNVLQAAKNIEDFLVFAE